MASLRSWKSAENSKLTLKRKGGLFVKLAMCWRGTVDLVRMAQWLLFLLRRFPLQAKSVSSQGFLSGSKG